MKPTVQDLTKFIGELLIPCGCKFNFTSRRDEDGKQVLEVDMCDTHMQDCVQEAVKRCLTYPGDEVKW